MTQADDEDIACQLHWHLFASVREQDNHFITHPRLTAKEDELTPDFDGRLPLVEIVRFVREAIKKETS